MSPNFFFFILLDLLTGYVINCWWLLVYISIDGDYLCFLRHFKRCVDLVTLISIAHYRSALLTLTCTQKFISRVKWFLCVFQGSLDQEVFLPHVPILY